MEPYDIYSFFRYIMDETDLNCIFPNIKKISLLNS
jgi:hypothetical protein